MAIDPQTQSGEVPNVDVAIIGAGIAGLAAAHQLIAAGYRVRVIESRDRVGGRLRSVSTNGMSVGGGAIDLGATWFWPGEPRIAALIEEFGIEVHAQHLAGNAMYHQPDGSQIVDGNPLDVTSGRFSNGAQAMAEQVASQLPDGVVVLNDAAIAVRFSDDGVVVESSRGTTEAKHVILALPPALAVSKISFVPPLPEQLTSLAAATPVWMGAIAKVVAIYDQAFWRDRGLSGSAISHYGPMRELHDMSGPDAKPAALFGFVQRSADSPAPSEEQLRTQLREIFGTDAPEPIQVVIADWLHDPHTSPIGADSLTEYQTYGHRMYQQAWMNNRLHWASTETSPMNPGHIEGALFGAERAVTAIMGA